MRTRSMALCLVVVVVVLVLSAVSAIAYDPDRLTGSQDFGYLAEAGRGVAIFSGVTIDYALSYDAFATLGLRAYVRKTEPVDIVADVSLNWYPEWDFLRGWLATAGARVATVSRSMFYIEFSRRF